MSADVWDAGSITGGGFHTASHFLKELNFECKPSKTGKILAS
jgi:hypothetical protein